MSAIPQILAPVRLDDKGRCCGRKPIVYKRKAEYYCARCHRVFDIDSGEQIQSWAYLATDGGFVRKGGVQ